MRILLELFRHLLFFSSLSKSRMIASKETPASRYHPVQTSVLRPAESPVQGAPLRASAPVIIPSPTSELSLNHPSNTRYNRPTSLGTSLFSDRVDDILWLIPEKKSPSFVLMETTWTNLFDLHSAKQWDYITVFSCRFKEHA